MTDPTGGSQGGTQGGTQALIRQLARDPRPVRTPGPPMRRGLAWSAGCLAAGFVLLAVTGMLDRLPGLLERDIVCARLIATLLTAVAAGIAAFQLSVPGSTRLWAWLPVPPLALWLAVLGLACFEDWSVHGPAALAIRLSADCVLLVLVLSLPPIAVAGVLVRQAAPLEPGLEGALVALAGAATGSALVQVLYPMDRGVQMLVWNFGSVIALVALGSLAGRWWFGYRP